MATYSKTAGTVVITHDEKVHPFTIASSAQDVSTKISATLFMYHAYVESGIDVTIPPTFKVQFSSVASGDEDWCTIGTFTCKTGTPATEALTATEPVAETDIAVASSTGFAAGDLIYIEDSTTDTDSEWAYVESIEAGPVIRLVNGLTVAKDAADFLWGNADIFVAQYDLSAVTRLRVLYANEGTAMADTQIKVHMVTADSIA